MEPLIFNELAAETEAKRAPAITPEDVSGTAGEQDHSNPWQFAGDMAEAPVNP